MVGAKSGQFSGICIGSNSFCILWLVATWQVLVLVYGVQNTNIRQLPSRFGSVIN